MPWRFPAARPTPERGEEVDSRGAAISLRPDLMSAPSERCILLRQSPDWTAMSKDEFAEQSRRFCQMMGRPVDQVVNTAKLWDDTFGITFCETRQAMKDIALDNLRQVKGATLVCDPATLQTSTPSDRAIYMFTDDDDWAHPDLFIALEALDPATCDGFLWRNLVYGRQGGPVVRHRPDNGVCFTNNYAVTQTYFGSGPESLDRVFQHGQADLVFPTLRVRRLPEFLSATNKNPSSTLFLEGALREDFSSVCLLRAIQSYHERLRLFRGLTPESAWIVPWATAVTEFYGRLLNRQS